MVLSVAAPARLSSSFVTNSSFFTRQRDSLASTAFPSTTSSPCHAPRASSHTACYRNRASASITCASPLGPAGHFGGLHRRVSVVRQGGAALLGLLLGQTAGAGLQAGDSGVRVRGDNTTLVRMSSWPGGLSDPTAAAAGLPGWLPPWLAGGQQRVSEAEEALKKATWPEEFPFRAEDFSRYDESPDTVFYSSPRFVTHIDDAAIRALTAYYKFALPPPNTPGTAILDMCSSWISHYPDGYSQPSIVGLGLNEDELKRNKLLTSFAVQDLNVNPTLPFEDNSFDAITNAVSVDYLCRPLEVFREMHRVLKPGGLAAMSFSNRCFWTKAISIWTSTGDVDHVLLVGSYFHYAGGFEPPQALDISPYPGRTDPMYVVFARKLAA